MLDDLVERLLKYVHVDSRAVDGTEVSPSSPGQTALIDMLTKELEEMDVPSRLYQRLGDGSLLLQLHATAGHEDAPHVIFAAHVDTYFGCPGKANPVIFDQYAGGDIPLPKDGVIIPASDLVGLEGKRLITTDGTTLLGADDKAGVAALMTIIEQLMNKATPHGPLTFWFCVDEEIGKVGVKFLPPGTAENWSILWTVDAVELNTIDVSSFNGAKIMVTFTGNDAHPGIQGDKLKPAHYAACAFVQLLGNEKPPWKSAEKDPFLYVPSLKELTAGKSIITVFPRSFSTDDFSNMHDTVKRTAKDAAGFYDVKVEVGEVELLYVNMGMAIKTNMDLVQPGLDAMEKALGKKPNLHDVRAGTDGGMANMTYPQLPAPNMGTGSRNLHGVREFLVVEEFERLPNILMDMISRYAQMKR